MTSSFSMTREKTTSWFSGCCRDSSMLTCFRSKNGRRRNTKGKSILIFKLLPRDILIAEIISKLCLEEEGLKSLCRLACVCKFFNEVANHPEILRQAKISFARPCFLLPDSKQSFVWKCLTMGNRRAMALVGKSHGFVVGDGETRFFVKERIHAAYFLGMILFESESTRHESFYLLTIVVIVCKSEIIAEFKRNARKYLSGFGINRPLNQVKNDCNNKCCGGWKMRLGCPLNPPTQYWCTNVCRFLYEYELFRVASLAKLMSEDM